MWQLLVLQPQGHRSCSSQGKCITASSLLLVSGTPNWTSWWCILCFCAKMSVFLSLPVISRCVEQLCTLTFLHIDFFLSRMVVYCNVCRTTSTKRKKVDKGGWSKSTYRLESCMYEHILLNNHFPSTADWDSWVEQMFQAPDISILSWPASVHFTAFHSIKNMYAVLYTNVHFFPSQLFIC